MRDPRRAANIRVIKFEPELSDLSYLRCFRRSRYSRARPRNSFGRPLEEALRLLIRVGEPSVMTEKSTSLDRLIDNLGSVFEQPCVTRTFMKRGCSDCAKHGQPPTTPTADEACGITLLIGLSVLLHNFTT